MTYQTLNPLAEYRLNLTSRPAEFYPHAAEQGWLVLDAPYQRGQVWTTSQKMALIRSFMIGVPVGAVIVNDRARGKWTGGEGPDPHLQPLAVIDGVQRISTVLAWYASQLPVPASWWHPDAIDNPIDTEDGLYITYSGLTLPWQRRSGRWIVPTCEASLESLEAEAEVYLLVNGGGTPQTDEDMARAAKIATSKTTTEDHSKGDPR